MPEDSIQPQAQPAYGTPSTTLNPQTPGGGGSVAHPSHTFHAAQVAPAPAATAPAEAPGEPAPPSPQHPALNTSSQSVKATTFGDENAAGEATALGQPADDRPVPVVKVYSVRGVEYLFMTLSLLFSAASLVGILLSIVNDAASFDVLAFPLSLLVVTLPVFALLFLRLRRAELANPELRLEASKRRLSQITQTISFLTCIFTVVAVVNIVFASMAGSYNGDVGKALLNALVILLVAGGLLLYYWFDEHKLVK